MLKIPITKLTERTRLTSVGLFQLRTYDGEVSVWGAWVEVPFNLVISVETGRWLFHLPSVYKSPITKRSVTVRFPSTLDAILEVTSQATRRRREEEEEDEVDDPIGHPAEEKDSCG